MLRGIVTLFISSFFLQVTGQRFQFDDMGSYEVGFQTSIHYDLSRPPMVDQHHNPDKDGRALQINIWHPLESTLEKRQMSYADYLLVEGEGPFFDGSDEERARKFLFRYTPQFEPYFDSLMALELPMKASQNATLPNTKYPVIMLMHDGPSNFCLMAELLASHGYVVVNFPVFGSTGIEFDNRTNAVESEVRDIEFALSVVKGLSYADMDRLVLAGFSYGGLSITAHQMRHQMAKALISFDTGITDSWGVGMVEKTPYYNPETVTVPILHFWTENGSWTQDLEWINTYKYAERHSLEMSYLRHFDFTNQGLLRQYFPEWIEQIQSDSLGNYVQAYELMGRESVNFLNSVFSTEQSYSYISDGAEYQYFQPIPLPPAYDTLVSLYRDKGFSAVKEAYNDQKVVDPIPFSLVTFNRFSVWLDRNAETEEAITWAGYFEESYPSSVIAQYRLARAYEKAEQLEKSKEAYQRIVELAPLDYSVGRHFRAAYLSRAEQELKN